MKCFNLKTILTFAIILCMLMSSSVISMATYNKTFYSIEDEKHLNSQKEFSSSVDDDSLEEYIRQELMNSSANIDVSMFNIPKSDAGALAGLIFDDIPEAFHISGFQYSISYGKIKNLLLTYTCTPEQYTVMLNECMTCVDKILTGIKDNNNIGDVEKALLIHDRLAVHCEYDNENLVKGTIPEESFTMYGALAKKIAVCQGYAEAYEYMLELVGIDCCLCESVSLNHTWNIVEINDEEYHVDVTWDDVVNDITGRVNHNNFLLSTTGIYNSGHNAHDYDNDPDDTRYDNAFWKNSTAEFQLIGNELYYVDNISQQIKKYSNKSPIINVEAIWYADGERYWLDNFTRLSSDDDGLIYSQPDAIYRYDLNTQTQTTVWKPTMPTCGTFSIFGFTLSDDFLICDINNSPNFSFTTKKDYQQKKHYEKPAGGENINHKPETIEGKPATCTESGLTEGKRCSICGTILVPQTDIPATGHNYIPQIIPSDCINQGYTKHTCSICKDTYNTDYTAVSEHKINNGKCINCKSYIAEAGHSIKLSFTSASNLNNINWKTKDNNVIITNTGCNVYETDTASEQLYEYYATINCIQTGDTEIYVFLSDLQIAKEKVIIIPHVNHTLVTIKGTEAQCEKAGLTDGCKCSFCDKIITPQTTIPAKGHTISNWIKIDNAHGGNEKYLYKICTICNVIIDKKIDESMQDSPALLIGDINDDGRITAADARLALRISAHLETPDERQSIVADYDRNGKITASDARLLLRKAAGLD